MKKILKSLIVLPLLVASSQWAMAASITCDLEFDADPLRTVTLSDYEVGSLACGPSGITSEQNENTYFTSAGYSLLTKIDFDEDASNYNDSNEFFSITGLGGTSGTFSMATGLTDATVVFKYGSGQSDPDWISFVISDIAADESFWSNWTVNQNQALSHVSIWGGDYTVPVPEPGTALLLATGIFGLVASRKRLKKAA